jgi:hypothetical protein
MVSLSESVVTPSLLLAVAWGAVPAAAGTGVKRATRANAAVAAAATTSETALVAERDERIQRAGPTRQASVSRSHASLGCSARRRHT